ncbi:MAG: ribonuclease P protein component [Pseudomonadales bacterium]|jgi:ribonuclease P protein component
MADYQSDRECFHRSQRLLNAGDFQQVFDNTQLKASTRELLILGAANSLGHSRIGFIIAKKNIRRAVQRNRIRRIIREYFRVHCHELNAHNAVDLVIMARKGFDQLSNSEINSTFSSLWNKLVRQSDDPKRRR